MWDSLFALTNGWAVIAWLMLITLPRTALLQSAIFYAGIALLCFAYVLLLLLVQTGVLDPVVVGDGTGASFTSIAGVRALFASDGGIVIGWLHYLAFDLFVGLWIAKDGDQKGFSRLVQMPVLALTFMFGPAGLLVWMAIRERRARAGARSRS